MECLGRKASAHNLHRNQIMGTGQNLGRLVLFILQADTSYFPSFFMIVKFTRSSLYLTLELI
jgi:hypothetical protein